MNTVRIRQFGPLPTRDARMSGRDTVLDDKFRITPNSRILAEPAPEVGPATWACVRPLAANHLRGYLTTVSIGGYGPLFASQKFSLGESRSHHLAKAACRVLAPRISRSDTALFACHRCGESYAVAPIRSWAGCIEYFLAPVCT
jgi:hypothetical protein